MALFHAYTRVVHETFSREQDDELSSSYAQQQEFVRAEANEEFIGFV